MFIGRSISIFNIVHNGKDVYKRQFIKDAVTALEANDNFVNKYNLKLGFKILFDTQK